MRILSPGKLRGMGQIASPRGIITVTAIDHRGSLEAMLKRALPGRPIGFAEMASEKLRIARALAPLSTAVLLDPLHGGHALSHGAVPGTVGLIMCLEEFGYEGQAEGRLTTVIKAWSVAKIKRMGAVGVKVLLFYHPEAPVAARQEEFVRRVAEDCRRHDIALLLEPMSYAIRPGVQKESAEFAREKPEIVIESARRLGGLGVDLLKAEFPADPRFETDEGSPPGAVPRAERGVPGPVGAPVRRRDVRRVPASHRDRLPGGRVRVHGRAGDLAGGHGAVRSGGAGAIPRDDGRQPAPNPHGARRRLRDPVDDAIRRRGERAGGAGRLVRPVRRVTAARRSSWPSSSFSATSSAA